MADLKSLAEEAATKASLIAGKDAARRAISDLLLTDEEKSARAASEERASKGRRNKLLVLGVLGLFVFIGVVGLLLTYWQWFLAAGVLGLVGLYGWWRLRKRLGAKREDAPAKVETARVAEPVRAPAPAPVPEVDAKKRAEELREARAQAEQEVDDELAAMKARLKK